MNGVNELAGRQARQEWQRIQNRVGDFERREWPRFTTRVVAVDSAYTVEADDGTVLVDTSSTAVTVTLPTAVGQSGRIYTIKDATGNAETNNITIDGDGSETIDGAATHTLDQDWAAVTVQSDGANWLVVDDAGAATAEPAPTYVYARLYATLADAVTAAQAIGAIGVLLEPGTAYAASGTVTITTDNLNIIGGPGTTINHTGTLPAFNVEADGVQFRGITISRASPSGSTVIFKDCTRARLIDCNFSNGGVQVGVNVPATIHEELYISRCTFTNSSGNGLTLLGVRNALIESCLFEDNDQDGVKFNVFPCEGITLLNCRFIDNNDGGVDFYGGAAFSNALIRCYFQDNRVEIKEAGSSGNRAEIHSAIVRDCVFGANGHIEVFAKYLPFIETNDTITGDGSEDEFDITHQLGFTGTGGVIARVFDGATELVNPTDFSYTTPDINTVHITFASPVPNGEERQVNIMAGTIQANDRVETTLTAGSSSYPIAHNLRTKLINIRAYDTTTQSPTTISSITYTDENNITVAFSGALSNDHRLLIQRKHDGMQHVIIEGNLFYDEPGASRTNRCINLSGATQYIIRNNFFRDIQDVTCIEATGARVMGIIEGNYFLRCENGFSIRITDGTSVGSTGMYDRQATVVIRNNTAAHSGQVLISASTGFRNHRIIEGNRFLLPTFAGATTATAADIFQDIAHPSPGYRREIRDNVVVAVDGTIHDIAQSEDNYLPNNDATPDVSSGNVWRVFNTNPTTYTDLDGLAQDGETKFIHFENANTTIDFSGTNLIGNNGVDWTPATGDAMRCTYYNNKWYCSIIEA